MFDPRNAIGVRTKPYGSNDPYHEWKAKIHSPLYAGDRNECFIEAVTDERFEIEVILHPLYPWKEAPNVLVKSDIDGAIRNRSLLDGPEDCQAVSCHHTDYVNCDVNCTGTLCGFTFGQVETVDGHHALTGEEEQSELSRRGKIAVVVQRGNSKWRKEKKTERGKPVQVEKLLLPSQTTKTVSIDKGRSHYAHLDNPTSVSVLDWTPAKYDAGEEIKFTFWYTSREYLEIQGIVSIIPTPNTEDSAIDIEPRRDPAHVTSVSTNHVSNGVKRAKVEEETGRSGSSKGTSLQKAAYGYGVDDRNYDDEENLPHKPVKREESEDLYNATPRPSPSM